MKTIQKRWLPLFLLVAVTFLFTACEGNNPDDDLVGVVSLKMRSGNNEGNRLDFGGATTIVGADMTYLGINNANNFKVMWTDGSYMCGNGDVVDMGKKRLSQITSLPTSGWTQETAVIVGHGYVFRARRGDYEIGVGWKYTPYNYIKVYVKNFIASTSGGIIGAEVQYCEWTPEQ